MQQDLQNNSVSAVITDPPYGLSLLQEEWDQSLPSTEIWRQCFRVLKPGGFCVAFGHVKTFHRLACNIEDAGFVLKDCFCWGYATGTPYSLDLSKAFDKKLGMEREVIATRVHPTLKNKPKVKSSRYHVESLKSDETAESWDITAPASDEAKKWNGWGTALKTAWEPILLFQKPLEGTYIENVKKYNIGGINIDECRIPYASEEDKKSLETFLNFAGKDHGNSKYRSFNGNGKKQVNVHPDGRWPANMMWLDEIFPEYDHIFMVPKPSKHEKRDYNDHPSVKPVHLMERLIKLVTPNPTVVCEDVIVLDPFMGSGGTGVACKKLNRTFYGYELSPEYYEIAVQRFNENTNTELFK